MRLVYFGTPEVAVPTLRALVDDGHEVLLAVTGPDKRRGRGNETSPCPVKRTATELGIPVSHDINDALSVPGELGVVVAFGRILPPHLLTAMPMVNLHFSLLPRWRGAAPVERAIMAGDSVTGVCVMAIEPDLDTGGVFARVAVPIGETTTADELRAELVLVGSRLLVETIRVGLGEPEPQAGVSTYAAKIRQQDLRIDWSKTPQQVSRIVRVGGAWTTFRGTRLKVHDASIVDGVLVPSVVQPDGKPRMSYDAWRNGAHPHEGESFQ